MFERIALVSQKPKLRNQRVENQSRNTGPQPQNFREKDKPQELSIASKRKLISSWDDFERKGAKTAKINFEELEESKDEGQYVQREGGKL